MSQQLGSAFDLTKFKDLFKDKRKDLVYMARTAESAERYDDMCKFMRMLVEWADQQSPKCDLIKDERNLLSVAYKNVIGLRRASWRTLEAERADSEQKNDDLVLLFKGQVEAELSDICNDALDLLKQLEGNLPESSTDYEARVFYLKMTGDYYRYLAESVTDKEHDKMAAEFYSKAFEVAEAELAPIHPLRLGLALNYSVCFYEILKEKTKACKLAKDAFDDAIKKLDQLEEDDYKDSTLIMQLLRDNLTLWTSNEDNDEGDEPA